MSSTYVLYAFHNFLSNILFYLFIYINSQFKLNFFVFLEISKIRNRMEINL